MNAKELEQIKARCEAATPGKWALKSNKPILKRLINLDAGGSERVTYRGFITTFFEVDATFIAHAREDIPALVSEVERLNKITTELERQVNALVAVNNDHIAEIVRLQAEVARLRAKLERIASIAYEIDWGVVNQAKIGEIIDIAEDKAQHVKSVLKIIRDGFKEEGGEG